MQPKSFTLFKRGKRYYAKACFLGTVGTVSTGTDQLTLAQLIAPRLLAEKFANIRKTWTVSKVLKHHQKHAVHLRPRTIKMVQEFTRIYLAELGLEHNALIQQAFTAKMANEFFRSRLKRAKSVDRTSISITANTILRMVKTLFTARMLETYDELPPEIEQFRTVRPLPVRHPQYSVADKKSKMARVIERCHSLEDTEPGPYLAFWLMLYCGLRRAEVAASRWS